VFYSSIVRYLDEQEKLDFLRHSAFIFISNKFIYISFITVNIKLAPAQYTKVSSKINSLCLKNAEQ